MKQGHYLGKYEILDVLGQGGNGVVYLAKDTILGKKWAIKQIQRISDGMEEALVMRELDHPGIPRITEQMDDENSFYIVMDYCKGESLWQHCKREQVTVDEIIDWGIQLCDILNYLHGQNPPIIFRDVKPGNIICGEENRIKLVDFGIAKTDHYGFTWGNEKKATHDMAENGKISGQKLISEIHDARGTRGFAAPEQYQGKYSIQSDVYNLGATLLWCMKEHRCGALQKILKKAMAQEAGKRYKDCHLLKKKLLHLQKKREKKKNQIRILAMLCFFLISAGILGNIAGIFPKLILDNVEAPQVQIKETENGKIDLASSKKETEMHTEDTQTFFEHLNRIDALLQNRYAEEKQSYIENLKIKKESLVSILEKLEGGTALE